MLELAQICPRDPDDVSKRNMLGRLRSRDVFSEILWGYSL